jgi:endo-1,4-beta-xylanase
VFDTTAGDLVAQFAQENNKTLRCHTLVWGQALPDWVKYGNFSRDDMIAILKNHVTTLVTRFSGCSAWDVVNEAIDENGQYRSGQDNVFFETIGKEYVPIAFAAAHNAARAANRTVKLYYNDYGLEDGPNYKPKIEAVKAMVDEIRVINVAIHCNARGWCKQSYPDAEIDGIGFQSHFDVTDRVVSTDAIAQAMQNFTDMELDVAMTELQVWQPMPTTPEGIQRQQDQYKYAMSACKGNTRCVGITTWDFSDKYQDREFNGLYLE